MTLEKGASNAIPQGPQRLGLLTQAISRKKRPGGEGRTESVPVWRLQVLGWGKQLWGWGAAGRRLGLAQDQGEAPGCGEGT